MANSETPVQTLQSHVGPNLVGQLQHLEVQKNILLLKGRHLL